MNPIIKELQLQRAGIITSARAILDKADAESRNLTDFEKTEYDALLQKADDIAADISRRDRFESHHNELSNTRIDEREIDGAVDREQETKNNLYAETADGEKIRLFRSTEKWETAGSLPDGIRADELSLGRFLRGVYSGNWKGAEAELRAMQSTVGAEGGYLVPEALSDKVIEAARPKTRVIQAGALQFKMSAAQEKFAKIDTYPALSWYEENAEIDSDDLGLSALDFRAQKIAVIVPMSLELLEDGNGVDRVVNEALSSSLAQALDRIAFYGTGGDRPLGLLNNADVGTSTVSTAPAVTALLSHILDAEFELLAENLEPSEISMIYNSSFGKSMALMTDAANHYIGSGNAPLPYAQMMKYVSNQLEDADSVSPVVFGRFSDLFIGVRQEARIEMSKHAGTAFAKNQALIRITWRGDILPVVPAHFHILHCAV